MAMKPEDLPMSLTSPTPRNALLASTCNALGCLTCLIVHQNCSSHHTQDIQVQKLSEVSGKGDAAAQLALQRKASAS